MKRLSAAKLGRAAGGMGAAVALVAAGIGAQGALSARPAVAASSFSITRLAGADRYATAADIARHAFPSGASTVLLATGDAFPDALAGNFLAGNLHAPLLLTAAGALPGATAGALSALDPRRIVILGGTSAVSAAVQRSLVSEGYAVARIAGASRYDTMRAIAEYRGTAVGREPGTGSPTAILATGENFPDALSAGPLSAADRLPVVLTDGQSPFLSPQAARVLGDLHIRHVVMVGGTSALNPLVDLQLLLMGITVDHQGGPDRSATSSALAQDELAHWGFSPTALAVARGDGFADALAGGAAAALRREPLLVTLSPANPGSSTVFAADHAATEVLGRAFGGVGALANSTLAAIARAVTRLQPRADAPVRRPVAAPPPARPPGTSPFAAGALGYDISWPQCPGGPPSGPTQFTIVGVNDGHAFSINPCLGAQAAYAGSNLSLYINLNSPDDAVHSMTGPAGSCGGSDLACQSYNYGYHAGVSSMADAAQDGVHSSLWWLDVETGNTWSSDTGANAKVIAGAVAALQAAGNTVAVYSTPYQWGTIAGGYEPGLPEWFPTGLSPANLAPYCDTAAHGFSGGPIWLVQYGRGNFDGDYAC